jgi:hypothetical protein
MTTWTVPDSFYNFTVSAHNQRNFLYVAKEKYETHVRPEKTDIQDFDTYGTKYEKSRDFLFLK